MTDPRTVAREPDSRYVLPIGRTAAAGAEPAVTASRGTADSRPGAAPDPFPCSDGAGMSSPDRPQTDQPKPALVLKSRAELRDLLIEAGLARAAAEKVARGGWPALAGGITETDLIEEAAALAASLAETFGG